MAARGPKRVAGEVFCCFLLGKVVLSNAYFVNKQLTYFIKNSNPLDFSPDSELAKSNEHFLKV